MNLLNFINSFNNLAKYFGLFLCLLIPSLGAQTPHTIYFLEDFRPYVYLDENQQPAGLMSELVIKALEDSGLDYQLVPNNVSRLFMEIKKGGNVSTFGVYKTAEREQWSIVTPEIYRAPQPVLVIKKTKLDQIPSSLTLQSFEALLEQQHLTGVIIKNYSYGNLFDPLFEAKRTQVQRYQLSIEQAFKMITSPHRADFTLAYPAQARYLVEQNEHFKHNLAIVPFVDIPANDRGAFWMFSKDSDPKFIEKIENAMNKVRHSAFYETTVRKYVE
ncbi:substrate-binding periplasmic protein [Aliikangiella marina]|uniref:substrate-binding periplasmic protein n=1 Tax=Aliikangiella marina TaxID=1712262 RepID=UPI00163DD284|nr:transporter substrate-binding domain-containing protein [Aliikangiella marina]